MANIQYPLSTFRVQFHQGFTFADLLGQVDYLSKLGIDTLYASPVFESMPGSTHGYDGTNPNRINPEIGSEESLRTLAAALKEKGISWLQDIVPNHLSFHEKNEWLMDVLRHGPESSYASFFDILWDHPEFPGRVMVPFPGSPLATFLEEKIPDATHYAVTDWRLTDHTINYRRFFTVNSLICTNVQHEHVFNEYHRLIAKLLADEVIQGLRIDHVDGLYDPRQYLERLRKLAGQEAYVVVEKILEPDENLPDNWDVQGTSGYEFLGMANNLFTNVDAQPLFDELYQAFAGPQEPVDRQIAQKKSLILWQHMEGELNNLVRLYRQCGGGAGLNESEIKKAIADYLISCPVYRYYGDDIPLMEQDRQNPAADLKTFYRRAMQFTGPLMAKGVEDTLMYTFNRFIGHNEVGDAPQAFGVTPEKFHSQMAYRAEHWPLSLNTTSTHDTKRGEDARARLNALTDFGEEWRQLTLQWKDGHASLKKSGMPDGNDEYFIYQTLLATFPLTAHTRTDYPARIAEYLQKSLREAKTHTSWSDSNEAYEQAAIRFAHSLIDGAANFHDTFMPFLEKVADHGMLNSLSQLVLKFTCPGIPDTYQGTELWDLSLVDPDNRRPVDFAIRNELLSASKPFFDYWPTRKDGQVKLKLLQRLLQLRQEYPHVFAQGNYSPVAVTGPYRENLFTFARATSEQCIVVAVPLHSGALPGAQIFRDWQDTQIALPARPGASWKNLLDNSSLESANVSALFSNFPLAILTDQ